MTSSIRRGDDEAAAEQRHRVSVIALVVTATRHSDIDNNCDVAGRGSGHRRACSDSDTLVRSLRCCPVVRCTVLCSAFSGCDVLLYCVMCCD